MADFSIPLQGMLRASSSFDQAAARIAHSTVSPASANRLGDTVDLSHEIVAMLQAKSDFAANAKAVSVFDDLSRSTLDMVG